MEAPAHRAIGIAVVFAALALAACAGSGARGPEPTAERSLSEAVAGMEPAAQVNYLRELSTQRPDDANVFFYLGNAYYAAGEPDSAVASFRRAVAIDTTMSKAHVNMGLVYDAARRRDEAIREFRRAIEINPDDVLAYCHLGQVQYSRGQVDEAIKLYKKALEIDPESAQAHYNLGLAFADAKIFGEALTEWTRVIELDPDGELGRTAAENVKLIRSYLEVEP